MAKSNFSTTISIDTEHSVIHFYSTTGGKSSFSHYVKSYAGDLFGDEFFKSFKGILKDFANKTPSESVRKVTVVLPDCVVLTDTVKIPTMKGSGQTQKMLDVTLGGLYRNYSDLSVIASLADQNKQYSTFSIAAVQKRIVSSIYAACSENKFLVETLTYASSAAVGGATVLNPKLKNASYLFLDIKDVYSRFVFVINGRTSGYYTLPFGLEFLKNHKVIQEDMLFDHSVAELAVLNAKEKAKAKKLTVLLDEDIAPDEEAEIEESAETAIYEYDEDEMGDDEEGSIALRNHLNHKTAVRKTPRKLPKFMLRDIPETADEIAYENFRVFVKWALTLIEGNEKLVELARPEFVCVNLPRELEVVLDMANKEIDENKISFINLRGEQEDTSVMANLELFGGLYPKHINTMGKF